jgi:glycerol-3-phosphate acyltransferase PlsY
MIILIIIAGYLLGSIPFGLLLTKVAGLGDIRSIGSGNIGATNVLRTGKKGLALLTLLLDGAKGAAAVLLATILSPDYALIAGSAALLGHVFPAWLKFKGGKGVATMAGVVAASAWPVGIASVVTWVLVAALSRYSSFAALVSLVVVPVYACLLAPQNTQLPWFLTAMSLLVIWKHKANIQRLISGAEPKIGTKQKPDESTSRQ